MLGSFGILNIQRSDQRFVVRGDWLPVLFQTFDIAGDGVSSHRLGLLKRAAMGHTTRQCGRTLAVKPPSGSGLNTIV